LVYIEVKKRFFSQTLEWRNMNLMWNNLEMMLKRWRILCPSVTKGGGGLAHFEANRAYQATFEVVATSKGD